MRLRLADQERLTLAEIAKRLGRKALGDVCKWPSRYTILAWYRRLIAQKFDGSRHRGYPRRPRVSSELEALVVRMTRENRTRGYDRIVGALSNLGHRISDQTVGNILRRYKIAPAPERRRVSGKQIEQLVDELILFAYIIAADPPRLPLPDDVHRFVSLNRLPGSLELAKVLLSLHSSLDGSMILLQDIVQILDRSMSTVVAQDSFLLHPWNRRAVEARLIGVDDPGLWM
jgi:hypothetical protein